MIGRIVCCIFFIFIVLQIGRCLFPIESVKVIYLHEKERLVQNSDVVYIWMNISDPCYGRILEKNGKKLPSKLERRSNDELLRYSIRSVMKYLPWFKGNVYVVSPGHVPYWLDTEHERVKIVNFQEILRDDKMYNRNTVERYLHRIGGISDCVILVRPEYLFTSALSPLALFGENGKLKLYSTREGLIRGDKYGKSWEKKTSDNALRMTDGVYGGKIIYNYVKRAPVMYSVPALRRMEAELAESWIPYMAYNVMDDQDIFSPMVYHAFMLETERRAVEFNRILDDDPFKSISLKKGGPSALQAVNHTIGTSMIHFDLESANDIAVQACIDFAQKIVPTRVALELKEVQYRTVYSNRIANTCLENKSSFQFIPSNHVLEKVLQEPPYKRDVPSLSDALLAWWVIAVGLFGGIMFSIAVFIWHVDVISILDEKQT